MNNLNSNNNINNREILTPHSLRPVGYRGKFYGIKAPAMQSGDTFVLKDTKAEALKASKGVLETLFYAAVGIFAAGGSVKLITSEALPVAVNKLLANFNPKTLEGTESAAKASRKAHKGHHKHVKKAFTHLEAAFSGLDENSQKLLEENPKIREFYSSFDKSVLSEITSKQIAEDLADQSFIKGLNLDFANTTFKPGSDETASLAALIAKRNAYLEYAAVEEFMAAAKSSDVFYKARAKSAGSVCDKLNSKLKDGAVISSFEDANKLIADGIGTRAIFSSLSGKDALSALKKGGITDDELEVLKSIWRKNAVENLTPQEQKLVSKADALLSERQTQGLVDNLCSAVRNNKISLLELNNYIGKGSASYFSDRQLMQFYEAWKVSADAKAGKPFKLVTKLTPGSELAKKLGFSDEYIKEISEKSTKPTGYTACQFNFRYSNGAYGEGQFRGDKIQKFAEYEHIPYDIKKGKKTITRMIKSLIKDGQTDVARELAEYRELVRRISKDKTKYGAYNRYLNDVYAYLRKDERGILELLGDTAPDMPKLNIKGLSAHQNELLSKDCLESLSQKKFYTFKNPKIPSDALNAS